MAIVVDIVSYSDLRDLLQRGDVITHVNGEKATNYLKRVAQYCHRQTNSYIYNM